MRMRYLKHTHPSALGLALLAGCLYTGSAFAATDVPPDVLAQFQAQQAQAGGKSVAKAATVPGPTVHYYNGNRRVDLVLALDELQIDDPASSPKGALKATAESDAALATGGAASAEVDGDSTRLHVRFTPDSDVASLNETAVRLASLQNGRTVRAVLYRRADSGRGQEDRIAVTPRFSLKLGQSRGPQRAPQEVRRPRRRERLLFPEHVYPRGHLRRSPRGARRGQRHLREREGHRLRHAAPRASHVQALRPQ
jgi:hypothetical protein